MTYWTTTASIDTQFERMGHPGAYYAVTKYTSGQMDFTGSNYGYGAIFVANGTSASITLSGGGDTITATDLATNQTPCILPLSPLKIKDGSGSCVIYIFKRQQ